MRSWKYALLAFLATAAAVGIQYIVRTQYPQSGDMEISSALKPSFYRMSARAQADNIQYRKLAAASTAPERGADVAVMRQDDASEARYDDEESNEDALAASDTDGEDQETVKPAKPVRHGEDFAAVKPYEGPVHYGESPATTREPASGATEVTAESEAPGNEKGESCGSIEYRGDGMKGTRISDAEWAKVMSQFHDVKAGVLSWFDRHHKGFAEKSIQLMQEQLHSVKLDKPPIADEPDLSWRGVGVFTYSTSGAPEIHIGDGFVKLALKQPARSKFEFARLLLQSVAPCEMIKLGADPSWDPLLKCLGINEAQACSAGTYSEAGWAISSGLASVISPPGCSIPAFKGSAVACLKKVPLPFNVGDAGSGYARAIASTEGAGR